MEDSAEECWIPWSDFKLIRGCLNLWNPAAGLVEVHLCSVTFAAESWSIRSCDQCRTTDLNPDKINVKKAADCLFDPLLTRQIFLIWPQPQSWQTLKQSRLVWSHKHSQMSHPRPHRMLGSDQIGLAWLGLAQLTAKDEITEEDQSRNWWRTFLFLVYVHASTVLVCGQTGLSVTQRLRVSCNKTL